MSVANQEAQFPRDAPPFRHGALDAAAIRAECPQFRILIVGKVNAGKTTILRKVCNAKPDIKPVIYDAEGKEVRQDPTKASVENLCCSHKLTETWGHYHSHGRSRCRGFFGNGKKILQISPA
jgi:Mg-chelatase subunit ChlI